MWWKKLLAIKVSLVVAILAVLLVNATGQIHERSVEVKYLKKQVQLHDQAAATANRLAEKMMGMECTNLRTIKVNVTSYNPVKRQCDNSPLIGANGQMVTPGAIAISRDLERKYGIKFGDKVVIEGYGTFTVADYMNSRFRNRVDIISFIPKWSDKFGCKQGINLYFNKH